MAGFKLHVGDLADLQLVGGAYVVCRIVVKVLGAYLGIRWSKSHDDLRPAIGAALLCQAAVVIGLADFVETYWQDPWAKRFVMLSIHAGRLGRRRAGGRARRSTPVTGG